MDELLRKAWERNKPLVRLRYPYLTDEQIKKLREMRTVPLSTGELVPSPDTLLLLYERLERLEKKVSRGREKKI